MPDNQIRKAYSRFKTPTFSWFIHKIADLFDHHRELSPSSARQARIEISNIEWAIGSIRIDQPDVFLIALARFRELIETGGRNGREMKSTTLQNHLRMTIRIGRVCEKIVEAMQVEDKTCTWPSIDVFCRELAHHLADEYNVTLLNAKYDIDEDGFWLDDDGNDDA